MLHFAALPTRRVWPVVEIKSCPSCSKRSPKLASPVWLKKQWFSQCPKKSLIIWVTLVIKFVPRNSKSRPIWSHCTRTKISQKYDDKNQFLFSTSCRGVLLPFENFSRGQSYKASTLLIYDPRFVPDLKIPHYDSRLVNYERKLFIRLATGHFGVVLVVFALSGTSNPTHERTNEWSVMH